MKLVSQQRCSLLDSKRTLSLSFLLIYCGKLKPNPKLGCGSFFPCTIFFSHRSSSNPNPMKPKPPLCLLCSVIGCWHLYLPIRTNWGQGPSVSYMQTLAVLGTRFNIITQAALGQTHFKHGLEKHNRACFSPVSVFTTVTTFLKNVSVVRWL